MKKRRYELQAVLQAKAQGYWPTLHESYTAIPLLRAQLDEVEAIVESAAKERARG